MTNIAKWFYKQSKLVQILLLLIPGLNFFVELAIRWSAFLGRPKLLTLVFAVIATVSLGVFGWVDLVWLLLFDHLIFAKV